VCINKNFHLKVEIGQQNKQEKEWRIQRKDLYNVWVVERHIYQEIVLIGNMTKKISIMSKRLLWSIMWKKVCQEYMQLGKISKKNIKLL
jgi:hypothetical protein